MTVTGYVYLAVCLFAASPNMAEFRGNLVGGLTTYDGLEVDVVNLQNRTVHAHVDVSSDGSFFFRELPQGDYEVHVTNLYQQEILSTVASVGPYNTPFEIHLSQPKLQRPVAGTVSIQELSHPPSKQVRKLLESGRRMVKDNHYDDAVARFREAAHDAPECVQAHADLGLALSDLRRWDEAAEEYRAAVKLAPGNSILHSNLSAALASMKRFDEAGAEAETALKLDPRNARAHFIMAGVLMNKGAPLAQAWPHLLASQDVIPPAKQAVEKICAANRIEGCPQ